MKITRLIKLCGNIGTVLIITGATFKLLHYPYHNELLTIGFLLFIVFWIWTLLDVFKRNNSLIYKIIWIILIMIFPLIATWIYYHFKFKK